jgi:hypothetical protein
LEGSLDREREEQVLQAGLQAALDRIHLYIQKHEYPRDFAKLYEWLEDKIFSLFEAMHNKNNKTIYGAAGEVVIAISRIAEFAKTEMNWEEMMSDEAKDE